MEQTPEQKSNLARCAIAVLNGLYGIQFSMGTYATFPNTGKNSLYPYEIGQSLRHSCGSICCLLGHGPLVLGETSLRSWHYYSKEIFGVMPGNDEYDLWSFLFSYKWKDLEYKAVDVREQCALRVLAVLEGQFTGNLVDEFRAAKHSLVLPGLPFPGGVEARLKAFVLP